jgi:antitoxin component of MazEF toxin-antitoxin module
MELQINRWGNSLALRLPAALARDIGVDEGSSLSPTELGHRLLALDESRQKDALLTRRQLVERLRAMHKQMPETQPIRKSDMGRY